MGQIDNQICPEVSPSGNSLTPTAVQFGSIVGSTQLNYARRTQVTVKFIF